MKRLIYGSVLVMTTAFFASCAQHDPNSPSTSGGMPSDHPSVGVDTISSQSGAATPVIPTNDSANQQGANTTDTTSKDNR